MANILAKPYNKCAILRSPLVTLESSNGTEYIKVFVDCYTDITGLDLTYYKLPHSFNVLKYTDTGDVRSTCSLPFSCFDELVNGAVMMYMQYKTNVDLQKNDASRRALKNLTGNKEAEQ